MYSMTNFSLEFGKITVSYSAVAVHEQVDLGLDEFIGWVDLHPYARPSGNDQMCVGGSPRTLDAL